VICSTNRATADYTQSREESKKSTSTLSNFMYQFCYKRTEFAKYPKIDSGTPEMHGTQFEQHCYTINLPPWT